MARDEDKQELIRTGFAQAQRIVELKAENERYRIACQHTVDHHETYVDKRGVIVITLQSYALIKKALAGE